MFKGLKIWVFNCSALVYLIVLIYSYFLNLALDNGRIISQTEFFFARLFVILRYPSWIIWNHDLSGVIVFLAGAVNTCCYALAIERIIFLLFYRGKSLAARTV
jgi:hypothetical protein